MRVHGLLANVDYLAALAAAVGQPSVPPLILAHMFPFLSRPRAFLVVCFLAYTAACGAGGGTERELPPGPPTSAPPGDAVLYVSYAQANMIAAYRLGRDGFLAATPFSSMTIDGPRTIELVGNILYVGTSDRVVSATLSANGSLPALPTAETGRVEDGDVSDLLVIGDILYAAYTEAERLVTYRLEEGQVPSGIATASGETASDYLVLAESDGFIYTHAPRLGRIDTYRILDDGTLADFPEPQLPEVDLFGCEVMLVRNGTIYAGESSRERVNTYNITSVGLPEGLKEGEDPISHIRRTERYADIVLDGDLMYGAAFNAGRVDTFAINPDGTFPEDGPLSRTAPDTSLYPTSLFLYDGILYVAQAGRDRIDGYIIDGSGFPSKFPSTSADPVFDSYPNDIVVGEVPN
jgi:hypothetical protein